MKAHRKHKQTNKQKKKQKKKIKARNETNNKKHQITLHIIALKHKNKPTNTHISNTKNKASINCIINCKRYIMAKNQPFALLFLLLINITTIYKLTK